MTAPESRPTAAAPGRGALAVLVAVVLGVVLVLGGVAYAVVGLGSGVAEPPTTVVEQVPAAAAPRVRESSRSGTRGVDPAWVARTATVAAIPEPALRAYADAALLIGREQPDCRVGWNTLAGIGWVESHHGTIGGRSLRADGYSDPTTILGPALNGQGDLAAIRASPESTAWHGDATWDHAVGPLQFLTSSWNRWGGDGDGDGITDPRDLDDAAYAAARYLCADGHDLSTDAGWSAAIHSYNHSMDYVRQVAAAANTYSSRAAAG